MELQDRETVAAQELDKITAAEADISSSVVRWERFLPKMAVRVLLVEADDSTRHIIAALLRKCSYRVAAVADGLKAWEVLRGRPCNIDLILTEVDLPLITGYALLTLIMEHDVCKNIPVIMMSAHDSVSTVYKCMLRGAADFLVKPLRKNELRNLWQHIWRKQVSSNAASLGPPEESIGQKKDEATAENNSISDNRSSRCVACVNRSRECSEKGSDAQSSCTKPESTNDGDEQIRRLSQPISNKHASDVSQNSTASENSSKQAIDLIGAIDNHINVTAFGCSSNFGTRKSDVVPQLDLSLRRFHPSGTVSRANDERTRLNHSEASAFSRYISKPGQLGSSTIMYDQQKDHETIYGRVISDHCAEFNSDMQNPTTTPQKHVPMATVKTGHGETMFSYSPNRELSQPIPVRGVRYENSVNGLDAVITPSYCTKKQTDSLNPSDCLVERRNCNSIDPADGNCKDHQNNGTNISHLRNACSGLNGNTNNPVSVACAPSECGSEGLARRSIQREEALTKFRLKRKDRCFEKKVRYESRKKLAEQRPRVKGQFVRQVGNENSIGG